MEFETARKIVSRVVQPLCSRKVRVALATVIAAYAGQLGLQWDQQMVLTVLGVGVALILGIAHEDAGARSTRGGGRPRPAVKHRATGRRDFR